MSNMTGEDRRNLKGMIKDCIPLHGRGVKLMLEEIIEDVLTDEQLERVYAKFKSRQW